MFQFICPHVEDSSWYKSLPRVAMRSPYLVWSSEGWQKSAAVSTLPVIACAKQTIKILISVFLYPSSSLVTQASIAALPLHPAERHHGRHT